MTERRDFNLMLTLYDHDGLAALTGSELKDFLLLELDEYDHDLTSDTERLISVGLTLAKAGHASADEPVIQWLAENPSPRRLNIASLILLGLWKEPSSEYIAPHRIEKFMHAREGLALQEEEEFDYVMTLCQSMEFGMPSSLKKRIEVVLRETLQRRFTDETLNNAIAIFIPRALSHS